MTVLMYTAGVLIFVLGVAASIGLHECGHMIPAKRFGVKVTQYFIGFGRTVWSRQKGETEYGLKAIPLGGYVKLVGMLPPGDGDEPGKMRKSNTGMFTQIISDARSAEYEHVTKADEDRLFYKLAWWKKVVVMAGGPTVNLAIAFGLFAVVFMGHGVPTLQPTVAVVADCVIAYDPAVTTERKCTADDPVAPAKAAGLQVGDRIVSFNGRPIRDWGDAQQAIRGNADGAATIVLERDGRQVTTTTNTTVSPRPATDDAERVTKVGFLGVTPTKAYERQGFGFVVTTMAEGTWETVKALGAMPVKLYHVGKAALGLEERDQNGPMSVVGAGRFAGQMAANDAVPVSQRFFDLLLLLAGLNLFLGMFNFVPLLPLDGGHIAGALYEAVRRGIAKLRRRPDPGFVDVAKLLPVAYVMAGVILVMSVVLIYADIVAPVTLS